MIKLELEVTTAQLVAIAAVLADSDENAVVDIPSPTIADIGAVAQAEHGDNTAGTMFANSPESVQGHLHQGAYQEKEPVAVVESTAVTPIPPVGCQLAKSTSTGKMIPWDNRIHASSKKVNADGTWRLKPGIDRENLLPQVEAELAALVADMPAVAPTPPASVPAPNPIEQTATVAPPPPATEQPHGSTAAEAEQLAQIPTGAAVPVSTFPELLPLVTAAKHAGTLTDEKINEVLAEIGLTAFGQLAVRTDLVAQFANKAGLQ